MKFSMMGAAVGLFLSSGAFADTLSGTIAYKDASDHIVVKSSKIDFDGNDAGSLKLALEDRTDLQAENVKVVKLETENRTVVLAAFHKVADLPDGTSLLVKANLLSGSNGKVLYGDVFTRKCGENVAAAASDEDAAIGRLMMAIRERRGCELEYRGGIVLSAIDQSQKQ